MKNSYSQFNFAVLRVLQLKSDPCHEPSLTDISENKQMRQQQLASIKRDRANLFSAMPSTNEQQFITEDNQLVIHNVGDGSQSPSKIKITVQELPPRPRYFQSHAFSPKNTFPKK